MESHLLQMRGLKLTIPRNLTMLALSHLLQMRGLKRTKDADSRTRSCRIFYRCVD